MWRKGLKDLRAGFVYFNNGDVDLNKRPLTYGCIKLFLLSFVENFSFQGKTGNHAGARLENEWLSFEKMIAPGGIPGEGNVDKSTYLVDGVVAYPGMSAIRKSSMSDVLPEVQPSESDSDEGS